MIDKRSTHCSGRLRDQMARILVLEAILIEQTKQRFVYQRSRLQGMLATLAPHEISGQRTQLRINFVQQLFE